jgi:hypothetical protein
MHLSFFHAISATDGMAPVPKMVICEFLQPELVLDWLVVECVSLRGATDA